MAMVLKFDHERRKIYRRCDQSPWQVFPGDVEQSGKRKGFSAALSTGSCIGADGPWKPWNQQRQLCIKQQKKKKKEALPIVIPLSIRELSLNHQLWVPCLWESYSKVLSLCPGQSDKVWSSIGHLYDGAWCGFLFGVLFWTHFFLKLLKYPQL